MAEPTGIDEALTAFGDKDYSVRLVRAVCNVVPFAPDLPSTYSLVEVLRQIDPNASRDVYERAEALTRSPESQRALWAIRAMDTADTGISVYSGLASAIKLYKAEEGQRIDALETDPQQAADAVLKGLALALVVHKLFEGGPIEKVNAFRETQAGQALIFYFAAIEVGLPFADNALMGGGRLLATLFEKFGPEQEEKLAAIAGPEEAAAAGTVMRRMIKPVGTMVKLASEHLTPIAAAVTTHLPKAIDVGDKIAGVAATGADLLPVYKFLGTRLVAEVCARRALAEVTQTQAEAVSEVPALVEIKYTTGNDKKELPEAPVAKRRSCLPFFVMMLVLGSGALAGLGFALAQVV